MIIIITKAYFMELIDKAACLNMSVCSIINNSVLNVHKL